MIYNGMIAHTDQLFHSQQALGRYKHSNSAAEFLKKSIFKSKQADI